MMVLLGALDHTSSLGVESTCQEGMSEVLRLCEALEMCKYIR